MDQEVQTDVDYMIFTEALEALQQQQLYQQRQRQLRERTATSSQGHLVVLTEDRPTFIREFMRLAASELRLLVWENVGEDPGVEAGKQQMIEMLMTLPGYVTVKQIKT